MTKGLFFLLLQLFLGVVSAWEIPSHAVCEHSRLTISCSEGQKIQVTHANYGRLIPSSVYCPYYTSHDDRTDCISSNSQSVVQRQCDGEQTCTISASNSVFGDPCFNTYKYLEVEFNCVTDLISPSSYKIPSNAVCEHSTLTITCPKDKEIQITHANYGRLIPSSVFCPYSRHHDDRTDCVERNSKSIVQRECEGKDTCSIAASNRVFGDPCVNTYKYLEVEFNCVSVLDKDNPGHNIKAPSDLRSGDPNEHSGHEHSHTHGQGHEHGHGHGNPLMWILLCVTMFLAGVAITVIVTCWIRRKYRKAGSSGNTSPSSDPPPYTEQPVATVAYTNQICDGKITEDQEYDRLQRWNNGRKNGRKEGNSENTSPSPDPPPYIEETIPTVTYTNQICDGKITKDQDYDRLQRWNNRRKCRKEGNSENIAPSSEPPPYIEETIPTAAYTNQICDGKITEEQEYDRLQRWNNK